MRVACCLRSSELAWQQVVEVRVVLRPAMLAQFDKSQCFSFPDNPAQVRRFFAFIKAWLCWRIMATRGNPSWQQRFDAQVPPSAKISLKKHWVAENGNADGRAVLAAREISLRSWLCLLCSEQKLPRVHCRDDVLWTLLVDLYLVYLVIREGLRVT